MSNPRYGAAPTHWMIGLTAEQIDFIGEKSEELGRGRQVLAALFRDWDKLPKSDVSQKDIDFVLKHQG